MAINSRHIHKTHLRKYLLIATADFSGGIFLATTIAQSFVGFKSNLEITGLQAETISTRQNNVRDAVKRDFDVLDSFLTGSYARSTMIAPLNQADVDIFTVLKTEHYRSDGQAYLLDKVKNTLIKTYPKSPKVSRNGQAVTITFTDFTVDLIPAFYRKGGGYLIPNTITSSWIATDPKQHISISSEQNKNHNGMLIPLVKMIKCWNKSMNYWFGSFHLEVMAQQILKKVIISDYPSGVRFFFDKGRDTVGKKTPDPAGYNDDVGCNINTKAKIDEAASKFTTAYTRASKAESFARDGNIPSAVEEWRKIFGNQFPAFG